MAKKNNVQGARGFPPRSPWPHKNFK